MPAATHWVRLTYAIGLLAILRADTFPAPPAEEQAAVIAATRSAAQTFTDHLPDFICTQVIRRWVGQPGSSTMPVMGGSRNKATSRTVLISQSDNWRLNDTLTIQLNYSGQKEQYLLLLINGQKTKRNYESLGGSTSYGEFGSLLGLVFQPSSRADFHWLRWASLNGRQIMVFTFEIARNDSQWRIAYESRQIVTALQGRVFIDPEQHQVVRLEVNADAIPHGFPIQKSSVELDYRKQTVGEQEYLLPLKAVDLSSTRTISTKNEIEFRLYRKFTADSKIDFNTPPPLGESQIKEEIPKP